MLCCITPNLGGRSSTDNKPPLLSYAAAATKGNQPGAGHGKSFLIYKTEEFLFLYCVLVYNGYKGYLIKVMFCTLIGTYLCVTTNFTAILTQMGENKCI